MTTRNLEALFSPNAIALIGASNEAGSVGAVLARNIVGPNCLGAISPAEGINASFAQLTTKPELALVAQSGAVTTAPLDWADARAYGFSRIATLGERVRLMLA